MWIRLQVLFQFYQNPKFFTSSHCLISSNFKEYIVIILILHGFDPHSSLYSLIRDCFDEFGNCFDACLRVFNDLADSLCQSSSNAIHCVTHNIGDHQVLLVLAIITPLMDNQNSSMLNKANQCSIRNHHVPLHLSDLSWLLLNKEMERCTLHRITCTQFEKKMVHIENIINI